LYVGAGNVEVAKRRVKKNAVTLVKRKTILSGSMSVECNW